MGENPWEGRGQGRREAREGKEEKSGTGKKRTRKGG